jgi:hypothetical protein
MKPVEVIQPGRYPDGQDRMGTPTGADARTVSTGRYKDGQAYRAGLRDSKN